jgi:hypothetical protein
MAKSLIQPGAVIDGFTAGERVHAGGWATLWNVTHPGLAIDEAFPGLGAGRRLEFSGDAHVLARASHSP